MKNITTLIVRIAGLAIIFFTVIQIPKFAYAFASQLENNVFVFSLPIFIPLVVGFIFFKFPKTFSDKFIELKETPHITSEEILAIILKTLGFVLLFYALSDTVYNITYYFLLKGTTETDPSMLNYDFSAAIATFIELLFALALIFKTQKVVKYVYNEKS